jgi:tetratricopeptide (TPR) repeat protein
MNSVLQSNDYQKLYLSKLQELDRNFATSSRLEPGLVSDDGSSIIGEDGWIYIYSGSNNFFEYFTGKRELNYDQLSQWIKTLELRINWHQAKSIKYLHLFVPNKLAIYPEFFPNNISIKCQRPIIQLQQSCGNLFIYPAENLVNNKNIFRLYEKQNSHWSFWGCFLVYEILCHKFGIIPNLQLLEYPIQVVTEKADLGIKFNLQEIRLHHEVDFKSSIVYDNELINYCNRGSIRILRNTHADSGKMIIFGDSFSNPGYPKYNNHKKRHIHRLASLFAETIREVHFIWSPWIDYEYIEREKPDFVVTEMAERFLVSVPEDNLKMSIQKYADLKIHKYRNQEEKPFDKHSSEVEKYFEKGNKLKKLKYFDESISQYLKCLKIKPDSIKSILCLAEVYEIQDNLIEASKCYRKLIILRPNNHVCYLKLAKVLKQQNKVYGAIAAYSEAIELKPDLAAGVYRDYGDLLLQVNNTNPDGITAYQKAVEIKQDWSSDFYNKLASLLEKQGKFAIALKYYLHALSLKEDNPQFYLNVGNIYFKQGKLNEAVRNYQRALELKPDFSDAYKRLGDLFEQRNQLDDAVRCYQKALEIKPNFKAGYRSLGNVLMQQGKHLEAQKCFQRTN